MKPQSIGTEVLQHFLLIQNGTIRAHQHVVVRVEFLKCCVVLACEGSIEHVAMNLQNIIFSHSVSSRSTEGLPFSSRSVPSTAGHRFSKSPSRWRPSCNRA